MSQTKPGRVFLPLDVEAEYQRILTLVDEHFRAGGTAFFVIYGQKEILFPEAHSAFVNVNRIQIHTSDAAHHLRWMLGAGWIPLVLDRWFSASANSHRSELEHLAAFVNELPDETFRRIMIAAYWAGIDTDSSRKAKRLKKKQLRKFK